MAASGFNTWKVTGLVVGGRCQAQRKKPEAGTAVVGS